MKLKPGAAPSDVLKEFAGSVHGTVRSKGESLIRLNGLKPSVQAEGSHPAGAEMKATLTKLPSGNWEAIVELSYDQLAIVPADAAGGFSGGGFGSQSVLGIRISDRDGKDFELNTTSSRSTPRAPWRGSSCRRRARPR